MREIRADQATFIYLFKVLRGESTPELGTFRTSLTDLRPDLAQLKSILVLDFVSKEGLRWERRDGFSLVYHLVKFRLDSVFC